MHVCMYARLPRALDTLNSRRTPVRGVVCACVRPCRGRDLLSAHAQHMSVHAVYLSLPSSLNDQLSLPSAFLPSLLLCDLLLSLPERRRATASAAPAASAIALAPAKPGSANVLRFKFGPILA